MKLTKREKTLIAILAVLVVCYLLYTFVFSKESSSIQTIKSEYNEMLVTYNNMISNVKSENKNESKIKELNYEIDELSYGFLNDIEQENVIIFLDSYLKKHKIYVNSFNFTDVTPISVPKKSKEDNLDSSAQQNEENTSDTTQETDDNTIDISNCMTINITYKASYTNVLAFIDDLQSNDIDIIIPNMNFTVTEDGEIQGSMTMSFYDVVKIEPVEQKEWIWKDVIKFGKDNPFYKKSTKTLLNSVVNRKYDFVLSAKPTSSDLPTLVFGESNDTTRESYIYADSNNIENLNITFKKQDGMYMYKYSTSSESYPEDGTFKQFIPEYDGNIYLMIYSTKRNSAADTSGVKINIVNESGLRINVKIEDDDASRPRISFDNLKGIEIN